ncbi:Dyp-type peroxidase [Comamonas composti]|uniref:Dyp-type peroxidase n=1 Tax=Comamonas composti TaxID=408558 RepID=UPI0004791CE0|nr:Dyp-type peroxidase [Comamonas composti]
MDLSQAGILGPLPAVGRYVFFRIAGDALALKQSLLSLQARVDGQQVVAGLGSQLLEALGKQIPGLHEFPAFKATGEAAAPSTPSALCLWLRGAERGDLLVLTRELADALAPGLVLEQIVDGFRHGRGPNGFGRDLTGYEDGTENPVEQDAYAAAIASGQGPGLDGSSYWALQQWEHDFTAFHAMSALARDHAIGRQLSDNEELEDAPETAHVKRTAQEDFKPEAFLMRRSMPWWSPSPEGSDRCGLMFSAFGCSFYAFEAQMRRMLGLDDGLVDALFDFSRALTGSYFWCPPMHEGRLDLSLLD